MSEPVNAARVRPAVRRLAIIAFVILVPIAAHSLWDYIELRRLVREIENIRAKGEPVSEPLDYPSPPPAPAGTPDAAGYYLAGAMLALEAEASPVITPVQEWFAAAAPDPKVLHDLNVPLGQLVAGTLQAALRQARSVWGDQVRVQSEVSYNIGRSLNKTLATRLPALPRDPAEN